MQSYLTSSRCTSIALNQALLCYYVEYQIPRCQGATCIPSAASNVKKTIQGDGKPALIESPTLSFGEPLLNRSVDFPLVCPVQLFEWQRSAGILPAVGTRQALSSAPFSAQGSAIYGC